VLLKIYREKLWKKNTTILGLWYPQKTTLERCIQSWHLHQECIKSWGLNVPFDYVEVLLLCEQQDIFHNYHST
jgi:hypothetical protein